MDKNIENRPIVYGKMIYRCEECGKSWPMYLEKGIEEFGENHKLSPITIICPHCGGWAMDVSGIIKLPYEAYLPISDEIGYFANVEGKDCGVPVFQGKKTDETDDFLQDKGMRFFIEDLAKQIGIEVEQEIEEAVHAIAEEADRSAESYSADKATQALINTIWAMMGSLAACVEPYTYPDDGRAEAGFINWTAWERKEKREKRRLFERETAVRFRQHKTRECERAAKKRTGARRREWRGPWKEPKTN